MSIKTLAFFLIFQLFWLATASHGSATEPKQKAAFKELTATTSETHLLVFGTLESSFTPEMISILHSGIALKFSYFIELFKTAENWPDEQVITLAFQHIMSYDTLKETYRVTLEEDNNKILPFKSLSEAQNVLKELNGTKVIALKQLIPNNRYKLKIRAELYQKTLPLSLHNVLPFLSWGDVATDWHSILFKY
jgi:hypothetical protein